MRWTAALHLKYGGTVDAGGFTVENFGYPINLMIACSTAIVEGTLEDCLKEINKRES